MKVQVKVKKSEGAIIPQYQSADAAGLDLHANLMLEPMLVENATFRKNGDALNSVILYPNGRALIKTGLQVEIPKGLEMQIRPRSGLALKAGITLINSPGTIDSDYRGDVGIIVHNTSVQPFEIKHGDRIAQAVLSPVIQIEWEEDELSNTDRGEGGFGHTGK
jgi:dUTP pyrophosphatase